MTGYVEQSYRISLQSGWGRMQLEELFANALSWDVDYYSYAPPQHPHQLASFSLLVSPFIPQTRTKSLVFSVTGPVRGPRDWKWIRQRTHKVGGPVASKCPLPLLGSRVGSSIYACAEELLAKAIAEGWKAWGLGCQGVSRRTKGLSLNVLYDGHRKTAEGIGAEARPSQPRRKTKEITVIGEQENSTGHFSEENGFTDS